MNPITEAACAALLLALASSAAARSGDRNAPMNVEADQSTCDLGANRKCTVNGRVVITQGSLTVNSANGVLFDVNGRPTKANLGGGVTTQQQLDDGTPVKTTSSTVDYDFTTGVIILTGSVVVTQPKGEVRGARVVYNTRTGQVQAGGGGERVRMVIQPKAGA